MKNDKTAATAAIDKFKSTEELSSAYAALEREFTKRCQLIKELQAKLDRLVASDAERHDSSVADPAASSVTFAESPEPERTADAESKAAEIDTNTPCDTEPPAPAENTDLLAAEVIDAVSKPDAGIAVSATMRTENVPTAESAATTPPAAVVPPIADVGAENAASAADIIGEVTERADELSDALSLIPEVMEACIARYKKRLMGAGISTPAVRGAAVVAPVKRPKTLSDAKRIADELMRNG